MAVLGRLLYPAGSERSGLKNIRAAEVVTMDIDKSVVDSLVGRPSESLAVESKRWIDPTKPAGVEKIVKGAFALRNRNGGYLVIGFEDKTLLPDLSNELSNARQLFHPDA